jgi:hypothetical protein
VETFVIRIWMPRDPDGREGDLELCGLAEYVKGGERRAFRGSHELVEFIESTLETPSRRECPEREKKR